MRYITKQIKSLSLLLLGIVLVAAYYYNAAQSSYILESMVSYVTYPLLLVHAHAIEPCQVWLEEKRTKRILMHTLALQKEEQERLLAENIALRGQLTYAEDSTELQLFKERYNLHNAVIAQVLVRHFSEQAHYFFIDAGLNRGIEVNTVVIYNNCLVGKVTEVYPWYSKITLITDRLCKVAGYCATTKAQGIHEGVNKENETAFNHVSHLSNLLIGDTVISSGEGLVFPQGFGLGKVAAIYPDGLYQKILVEPLCDFNTLAYCILLPKELISLQDV